MAPRQRPEHCTSALTSCGVVAEMGGLVSPNNRNCDKTFLPSLRVPLGSAKYLALKSRLVILGDWPRSPCKAGVEITCVCKSEAGFASATVTIDSRALSVFLAAW